MILTHDHAERVLERTPANSFDAVITDPPYNVVNRPSAGLRKLDKGGADDLPINIPLLAREFARIASGSIYVWCSTEQAGPWRQAFIELGLTTRQCVWIKSNPSPANGQHLWLSGVELCIFARHKGAYFGRHCKNPAWTGPTQRVKGFPCPKPVWLMRELVEASVPPAGWVLDPFAGSGSTGIAALESNRNAQLVELDPDHFNLMRNRIEEAQRRRA